MNRAVVPARPLPVAMICLWLVAIVATTSARADEGQRLLEDFIQRVDSLSARFEQSLVDADDVVIEESRGTVAIRRPGQFRWAYTEPYEQLLVADGLNVWSYDVDLAQVTVKPQAEVLANTPAALLSGSSDVLEQFEYDGSFTDRETVWIRLRPKDVDQGFRLVELGFDEGRLGRMIFTDSLDQSTLIALFDVSVNPELGDDLFHFEPPEDADLVGQPISETAAGG